MICPICEGTGINIDFSGFGHPCKCQRKAPQNLPKADAYSLLSDVRAWIEKNKNHADYYCVDVEVVQVEKLDDFLFKYISEHFS